MRTLTNQFVKAAPNAPEGKRDEHRDVEARGLALRVTDSGSKSWVLLYSLNGKKNRLTLGAYPSITLARARELANEHKAKVAEGIDLIEPRKPSANRRSGCAARQRRWRDSSPMGRR